MCGTESLYLTSRGGVLETRLTGAGHGGVAWGQPTARLERELDRLLDLELERGHAAELGHAPRPRPRQQRGRSRRGGRGRSYADGRRGVRWLDAVHGLRLDRRHDGWFGVGGRGV